MDSRARSVSAFTARGHSIFGSLEQALEEPLNEGLTSIKTNNRWFDALYEDRGANVTLVTFHAGMPKRARKYPVFSSRAIAEELQVNFLGFADPACGAVESLPTFWHLGTKRVDSQRFVPAIIRHALATRSGEHLVFFGSSAGGFAALNYSSKFPDSAVLVMNPRVDLLSEPNRFPGYALTCFPGGDSDRLAKRLPVSMSSLYSSGKRNTVAYLQNTEDEDYYWHHFVPFMMAVEGRADVYVHAEAWGEGHVVPPREAYTAPLASLVSNAPQWGRALAADFELVGGVDRPADS